MIFNIPQLLTYISQYMTLVEGDMIITGTPAGVGPVNDGDVLESEMSQYGKVISSFTVTVDKPEFHEAKL